MKTLPKTATLVFTSLLVACTHISKEQHSTPAPILIGQEVYSGPVLREKAKPVNPRSDTALATAEQLLASARTSSKAIGLAAPQIGIAQRVFVFHVPIIPGRTTAGEKAIPWTVAINPEYTPLTSEKVPMMEGCFSIPHLYSLEVPRYPNIRYQYYTLDGKRVEGTATGLFAQVFQHETDHLNGILYIDHLKDSKDGRIKGLILQSDHMKAQAKSGERK